MERITQFEPAFDYRSQKGGIHGVQLRMVLKGELGAVQFLLFTNWMLPHVQDELRNAPKSSFFKEPMPADLGYHSPKPMYEDHEPAGSSEFSFNNPVYTGIVENEKGEIELIGMPERVPKEKIPGCEYLDGKPCYYDGSSLNAEPVYHILLSQGSAGVWTYLEDYYKSTFGELK